MKNIKLLTGSVALLAASFLTTNVASAQSYIKPFVGKVNYTCQQGKKVTVRYAFNKYGLPQSATITLNGKKVVMNRNMDSSDNVETYFGQDGGYNMMTNYMDSKNYRKLDGINILSPSSEMLYKGCNPR